MSLFLSYTSRVDSQGLRAQGCLVNTVPPAKGARAGAGQGLMTETDCAEMVICKAA